MSQSEALELRKFFEHPKVQIELQEAAKGLVKPNDLIRLALLANTSQPDIARCSKASIIRALTHAASLEIEPSGVMGRGYLIPRRNRGTLELNFDPGYRGLADIAMRDGRIRMIVAEPVFENDSWDYDLRSERIVSYHRPALANRGKLIAAYAVADFRDGGQSKGVIVGLDDLIKVKAASAMKGGGPWKDWEERMAMKTAVRRLCMQLPYNVKLDEALNLATAVDLPDEEEAPKKETAGERAAARATRARPPQVQDVVDAVVADEADSAAPAASDSPDASGDQMPFGDGESIQ